MKNREVHLHTISPTLWVPKVAISASPPKHLISIFRNKLMTVPVVVFLKTNFCSFLLIQEKLMKFVHKIISITFIDAVEHNRSETIIK